MRLKCAPSGFAVFFLFAYAEKICNSNTVNGVKSFSRPLHSLTLLSRKQRRNSERRTSSVLAGKCN